MQPSIKRLFSTEPRFKTIPVLADPVRQVEKQAQKLHSHYFMRQQRLLQVSTDIDKSLSQYRVVAKENIKTYSEYCVYKTLFPFA